MKLKTYRTKICIILCIFTFIFSVFALGFLNGKSTFAKANTENGDKTYSYSDMFTLSEGAEITAPQQIGVHSETIRTDSIGDALYQRFKTGSVIKSDKPYHGDINATFTGDASLVFRFVEANYGQDEYDAAVYKQQWKDGRGEFKFYVTDVTDPTNYFIIHYMTADPLYNQYGELNAGYVQIERSTSTGLQVIAKREISQGFNNTSQNCNVIHFLWGGENGDELCVTLDNGNFGGEMRAIAIFDGQKVAKMNFSNGYRISFSSDWETGTDIAFKSILGRSLFEDPSAKEKSFTYEDFKGAKENRLNNSVWRRNTYLTFGENTTITFPAAEEVITYNGRVLTENCPDCKYDAIGKLEQNCTNCPDCKYDGAGKVTESCPKCTLHTVYVSQYEEIGGKFATAWKSDNMVLQKSTLSVTSIDTSKVDVLVRTPVTVQVGGVTYTYNFTVKDLTTPEIRLVGNTNVTAYNNKTVRIPYPLFINSTSAEDSVSLSVKWQGEDVTVYDDYIIKPTKSGLYEITYTAKNKNGATSIATAMVSINDDVDAPVISVDCKDVFVTQGTVVSIPEATATDNADGVVNVTKKVFYNGGEVSLSENGFSVDNVGEYSVVYSATDAADNDISVGYAVTVFAKSEIISVATKEVVSLNGATVETAKKTNKYVGLGITSDTAYTGQFNAVFEGDKELIFKFPGTDSANKAGTGQGNFYFKIFNHDNPGDYFTVYYGGDTKLGIYVDYKGQKRYSDENGDAKISVGNAGEWTTSSTVIGFNSDGNAHYNKLGLRWKDGVLSVIVNLEDELKNGIGDEVVIAKFDGTNAVSGKDFALPKLNWNSYAVAFGSNYAGSETGDKGSDVVFLGLDGETDFFATKNISGYYERNAILYNNALVERGGNIQVVKSEGVKPFYSLAQFPGLLLAAKQIKLSEQIPDDYGTHAAIVLIGLDMFEFNAVVGDEFDPPAVRLANDVMETVNVEKGSTLQISAADVVATDNSIGVMTEDSIAIFIKKDGASEFTAYASGFVFNELGLYVVKYVATDSVGNQAEVERYVYVVTAFVAPLVVNGEIPSSGYLFHSVVLPTATSGTETAQVYVVCNGNLVEISDNTLVFNEIGVYTVTYFLTNEKGNATKVFQINVQRDVVAPVIDAKIRDAYVLKGQEFSLPTVTAIDAVDGEVATKLSVEYSGAAITVTNNKFTASEYGAYVITYSATDLTGNVVSKQMVIYSVSELPENESTEPEDSADDSVDTPNNSVDNSDNSVVTPDNSVDNSGNSDTNPPAVVEGGCNASITQRLGSLYGCLLSVVIIAFVIKRRKNIN